MSTPDSTFEKQFEALVETFAEIVTGDTSPEMIENIKIWSIYNHIHKSMPSLTAHWNQSHPEGKAEIRMLFEQVRDLNQALKAKKQAEPPAQT